MEIAIEEQIEAPGREIARYRHLLNKKRRHLIRNVMSDLVSEIDGTIKRLAELPANDSDPAVKIELPAWEELKEQVQQIETLLGSGTPRPTRWSDLRRHLYFGVMQDLTDIIRLDWPDVKAGLTKGLYEQDEPIPVDVEDLDTLVAAQPRGKVITKLKWESLGDEDFERLIFCLISDAPGYENPEWLTKTRAPDRGRDLSVYRVSRDALAGVTRSRVVIQCRHWLTRSITPADIATLKEQMTTWEPPRVNVLVIATSGRFTTDAVGIVDKHNYGDRGLKIEMWPESHLERLLAERPAFIADFRLR